MIRITPYPPQPNEEKSYRRGFVVEGHAEYAERGQDIVCAGVSAITQTATAGLGYYNPIDVKHTSGKLKVHVLSDDHTSDAIIKTMILGLREMMRLYPDYIHIEETYETM